MLKIYKFLRLNFFTRIIETGHFLSVPSILNLFEFFDNYTCGYSELFKNLKKNFQTILKSGKKYR